MDYEESIVTYFDLLGFRQLVNTLPCSAIADIMKTFASSAQPSSIDSTAWKWGFSTFSDLAIRSVPIFSESNAGHSIGLLFQELLELASIQAGLARKGILVRGGVTVGQIHCSDQMVFGPALNRAYDLESTIAHFPRIVIDPTVFKKLEQLRELRSHDLEEEQRYVGYLVKEDSDGVWFVDYLRAVSTEFDDQYSYLQFLRDHKTLIENNSEHLNTLTSMSQKYTWLAHYHNATVRAFPQPRITRLDDSTVQEDESIIDSADEDVGKWSGFCVDADRVPLLCKLPSEVDTEGDLGVFGD
jgi:hypothetical protein